MAKHTAEESISSLMDPITRECSETTWPIPMDPTIQKISSIRESSKRTPLKVRVLKKAPGIALTGCI